MGGILDFSTQSTSTSYTSTITNTDSGNRNISKTNAVENAGNLTINYGAVSEGTLDRYLPWLAVGLVLLGVFDLFRR